MTRAAERQRLTAQQEAAAVLAQLEAEEEQEAAGSDADVDAAEPNGWAAGSGNAGRFAFGAGPTASLQVGVVIPLLTVILCDSHAWCSCRTGSRSGQQLHSGG